VSSDIPYYHGRKPRRAGTVVLAGVFLLVFGLVFYFIYPFYFETQQAGLAEYPGGQAKDYLSDDRYSNLHVEIDYSSGFGPDSQALNHFEQKLNQYLDKSQITVDLDDPLDLQGQDICVSNLADLENQHRDTDTGGDTIVLYIMYVSGECQGEGDVAGVTYSGSSFTVYKEKINDSISTSDPDYVEHRRIAEANVLLHEFGHIAGLVNELDFRSEYDHEDPLNPNHSKFEASIMYFEATFVEYQDFDFYDREDLKAIAAAPYPEPIGWLMQLLWMLIILGIIVIVIGGVLAAVERKRAPVQTAGVQGASQETTQSEADQYQRTCPNCGGPATYIQVYDRWYCYNCGEYL
jgi:ribosomal protein S27AE